MSIKTLFGPFKEILTMSGIPINGPLKDEQLEIISDSGILVDNGIIIDYGDYSELELKNPSAHKKLAHNQNQVVVPAYIDCHTHICWGGSRVNDYAMRLEGKSYLEIAAAGGGISDTVTETRKATEEELVALILARVKKHIERGISIIEIKSGYGLNKEDELKMLRAINIANSKTPADLIPTFLGAHIKPKDFEGTHAEYVDYCLDEIVPEIIKEKLAARADIFVEEGAFDVETARHYIQELRANGFDVTIHADQFHSGGSKMAIEEECVSADHLECTDEASLALLGASDTVAVALPGASIGLGMQFTACRKLLDKNACVAIATDWNPGSAPMGDLVTQASIIGTAQKLTIAETMAAITTRAAHALRIEGGIICLGCEARFTVYKTDDIRNIFYEQGQLKPSAIVIKEECIEF